jgi:hypothetical protein
MTRKELGCANKTSYAARIRLVKTENPSVCVTVNCKSVQISDSAVLPVVPS